jgi:2-oxo-4-hydroxy-4-carboxy-5-ureidoimidazoline decarboxylase
MSWTLDQINQMNQNDFTDALGFIFEKSPWVAEHAWSARPFASVDELHGAMVAIVTGSSPDAIGNLLRAHPDLAAKLEMSEISVKEQRGAGLNELSPEEFQQFTEGNQAYISKFGIPFIMAVRGQNKDSILADMLQRITNTQVTEFERALLEVAKIARFRLLDTIVG